MIEEAIVQKKKGKSVYVRIERSTRCDMCKACIFGKNPYIIVPVISKIECKVGDRVSVKMPPKTILAAPLLLYALPLIFMLIGALIGMLVSQALAIILAFTFLAIACAGAYLIDKLVYRKNPTYTPEIQENLTSKLPPNQNKENSSAANHKA